MMVAELTICSGILSVAKQLEANHGKSINATIRCLLEGTLYPTPPSLPPSFTPPPPLPLPSWSAAYMMCSRTAAVTLVSKT